MKKTTRRPGNAAGKKLCGMCGFKEVPQGIWRCTKRPPPPTTFYISPAPEGKCSGFERKEEVVRNLDLGAARPKIPAGVRFLYFGRPTGSNRHRGVMTVAYRVDPMQSQMGVGFSFCSPKDRWIKAIGQDLALRRLKEGIIFAPYLYHPRRLVVQIARGLMERRLIEVNNVCSYYQPVSSPPKGSGGVARLVPGWAPNLAKRLNWRRPLPKPRLGAMPACLMDGAKRSPAFALLLASLSPVAHVE